MANGAIGVIHMIQTVGQVIVHGAAVFANSQRGIIVSYPILPIRDCFSGLQVEPEILRMVHQTVAEKWNRIDLVVLETIGQQLNYLGRLAAQIRLLGEVFQFSWFRPIAFGSNLVAPGIGVGQPGGCQKRADSGPVICHEAPVIECGNQNITQLGSFDYLGMFRGTVIVKINSQASKQRVKSFVDRSRILLPIDQCG
jgi:hypothetical protein